MVTTLSFLYFHYGLIDFKYKNFEKLLDSWSKILHVGIPGAIISLFSQILRAILIKLAG